MDYSGPVSGRPGALSAPAPPKARVRFRFRAAVLYPSADLNPPPGSRHHLAAPIAGGGFLRLLVTTPASFIIPDFLGQRRSEGGEI